MLVSVKKPWMYRIALYNLHDCLRTKDDAAPSVNTAEVEIPVSTAGTMISMFLSQQRVFCAFRV